MSGNIHHASYPQNVNKAKVQAEWDEYARMEDWQEGCSGLDGDIRWIDHICDDEGDAYAYLEKHDRGWYDQLAVKYKYYPKAKPTKETGDLKRRLKEGRERITKINEQAAIQNRTSSKIGCPKCESQLALKYLRGQTCPVCGADLRSPTNLDRLNKARQNVRDLEQKLKDAEEKEARKLKPEIRWLVKIEYHT